jgi:glycerol-3-phosphate dehydrogenase
MMECYDLIIIGGGVVGLSILRAATLQGFNCALVEAQKELLSSASGSNSGIACTGVDASPGTLERALIRDSISQFRIYCQQHNIPTRKCGSLVCLWPWDDPSSTLSTVLKESHDAGDNHASLLTKEEVLQREPNLDSSIKGACHIPGEIVVDPWLYSISLAVHARENGASIFKDFRVDPELCKFEKDIWTIASTKNISVKGKAVVNAAGIFSDVLQAKFFGTSRWMAKPRRGQYRIYDATNNTMITHPIQPIPSQRTKGIFIFSTIYVSFYFFQLIQ